MNMASPSKYWQDYYSQNREKYLKRAKLQRINADPEKLKAYHKAYYEKNKAIFLSRQAKWRADNPKKYAEIDAAYRARYSEQIKAKQSEWGKKNRGTRNAGEAKREASKILATPIYADDFLICEIYELASIRSAVTGIKWQVDHIVPLQSRLVCGLHVQNNLDVIPAGRNNSKGNRHWPDMP